MISQAAQAILDRLDTGDRLIAYTAAGVSWSSAMQHNNVECPDWSALDELRAANLIGNLESKLPVGPYSVQAIEIARVNNAI
jgi:hypothetical protein